MLLCAASKLIAIFDSVQEHRQLSELEISLKRDLKARFLGMTAIEKLRAKQRSRLSFIRAGEANAKLFYLQANGRRRNNTIHSLTSNTGVCYSHEVKEQLIYNHFSEHFGPPSQRDLSLNWDLISLGTRDLSHLEEEFSEEEVLAVIKDLAGDKAPGPDGFIDIFLKIS